MREFLFSLFSWMFSDQITQQIQSSINDALNKYRQDEHGRKNECEAITLDQFVGHPVIAFSNEIQTPVVGFAISIEYVTKGNCPMLVVYDYISDQPVLVPGHFRYYSDAFLRSVVKMDPHALQHLLYGTYRTSYSADKVPVENNNMTLRQIIGKLNKNGFYMKLSAYEEKSDIANESPVND